MDKIFQGSTVTTDNGDDTYGIKFDDGEKKKYVKAKEMRKIDDQTKPVDGDAVDQAMANTSSQRRRKNRKWRTR